MTSPQCNTPEKHVLLVFPPDQSGLTESSVGSKDYAPLIKLIYLGALSWAPPLGLLYLAAELLDAGYLVSLVNFNVDFYNKDRIRELVYGKDVIGIDINTTGPGYKHAEIIVQDIRNINSKTPIILGGQGCTLYPKLIPGADVLVIGEAEKSIVQIIEAVINGDNLADIKGVIYQDSDERTIKKGPPQIYIEDLDTIKFPARQLVDKNRYSVFGPKFTGQLTTLISSRGCPFGCRFCGTGLHQGKFRERSVQNALEEIESIVKQGYKYLGIVDDHFLLNKRRAHSIFDGIIERGMNLVILVQARVDNADEILYRKMRAVGVRVIAFGLESGNQDTLDFYNQKTTVEKKRYAVELADNCGIYVHGSFILGAPMESKAHLERTIQFAKSLPLASVSFNALGYLPGSELWYEARGKGLIDDSEIWVRATRERGLSNFDDAYITQKIHDAIREFYARPSFWMWHLTKIITRRDREFVELIVAPVIEFLRGSMRNIVQI